MNTTTKEVTHTPTPWKLRVPMPQGEVLLMRDNCAGGWDGENVAEVFANSHGTALQNAEFILRAVNSYKESEFRLQKMREACHEKDTMIRTLLEASRHISECKIAVNFSVKNGFSDCPECGKAKRAIALAEAK